MEVGRILGAYVAAPLAALVFLFYAFASAFFAYNLAALICLLIALPLIMVPVLTSLIRFKRKVFIPGLGDGMFMALLMTGTLAPIVACIVMTWASGILVISGIYAFVIALPASLVGLIRVYLAMRERGMSTGVVYLGLIAAGAVGGMALAMFFAPSLYGIAWSWSCGMLTAIVWIALDMVRATLAGDR